MKASPSIVEAVITFTCLLLGVGISFGIFGFRVPFISDYQRVEKINAPTDLKTNVDRQ